MDLTHARAALKKYFGYDSFRPLQADIIQTLYDGCDAVVLMPTGGGKSMCFQIPAVTMPGVCVVVSPLIALMKDQVEGLNANGIKAGFVNSSQSHSEQREVEDALYNNELQLLYVSPEKLLSQGFFSVLRRIRVNLFAIDEAHCISSWGHDFRPEYTQLQLLKRQFPEVPVVALTATADRLTRKDIVEQLALQDPEVFISSFDRPNLSLTVRPGQKKFEQIVRFLRKRPNEAGIIYCISRKNTENIAAKLRDKGFDAEHYHAQLPPQRRSQVQEDFINDRTQIVCATVAFGMGIDKSNVRWVIHYNMPKNVESYYQEIGRAGRDGAASDTLLFYSFGDVMTWRDIINGSSREHGGSPEQAQLKLAKLDRMRQFAESSTCRRAVLLNYFSEQQTGECGNCDVCENPPTRFDGTVLAQKALSAISRLRQQVATTMLINVLRGSRQYDVLQRGYDKIKTYGAGAEVSYNDWQSYMGQFLDQGLIDIAYEHHHAVRLTPASEDVLFGRRKVELVKPVSPQERKKKPKTVTERVRDALFEKLRELRTKIARKKGVPPYIVFSDATLEEMAASKPLDEYAFADISGVGERKLQLYGRAFLKAIQEYVVTEEGNGTRMQGKTKDITLLLHNQGKSIEEIAQTRGLKATTIHSHIADLYLTRRIDDISNFISPEEVREVYRSITALGLNGKPERGWGKQIFEHLQEELPYGKIRMGLAYYQREHS